MNHENAFSNSHYGGDYMLTGRFTPSLLSLSLPLSLPLAYFLPGPCVDQRLLRPICHVFVFVLPVEANRNGRKRISKMLWNALDVSLQVYLMYPSDCLTNPSQDPSLCSLRDTHLKLNNVRLLCELRMCAAACLTVVFARLQQLRRHCLKPTTSTLAA